VTAREVIFIVKPASRGVHGLPYQACYCPLVPPHNLCAGRITIRGQSPAARRLHQRDGHCANTGFGGSAQPGKLMFMTIGSPDTVKALVGSSEVPLAAVDLPSGRLLAVNLALADTLGSTVGMLTGSSSLDWLAPDARQAARLAFQALGDGELSGFQAIRGFAHPRDPDRVFSVWVSVVDVEGVRVGLAAVVPLGEYDNQFRALPPVSRVPEPGNAVLGTVDSSWRVDRISQDVAPLLGLTPEQCAGQPVLAIIHPSDLPAFLAAVEHARRGERAVRLALRLSARSQDWAPVTVVLAPLSPGDPPPLAFALIRDDAAADPPGPNGSTREMQLEAHMLRIADELTTAGLIPRLAQLPVLTEQPQLGRLTSREWAVLARLLDGQRTAAIAADLLVSQGIVRDHLSSIYAKLGVHSQADLIRLVRRRTRRSAAGR
jgi:DNA-binding CsgD family transcriptional regulator